MERFQAEDPGMGLGLVTRSDSHVRGMWELREAL